MGIESRKRRSELADVEGKNREDTCGSCTEGTLSTAPGDRIGTTFV